MAVAAAAAVAPAAPARDAPADGVATAAVNGAGAVAESKPSRWSRLRCMRSNELAGSRRSGGRSGMQGPWGPAAVAAPRPPFRLGKELAVAAALALAAAPATPSGLGGAGCETALRLGASTEGNSGDTWCTAMGGRCIGYRPSE